MKEPLFARILKYALCATFVLGVAGTISMPFMIDYYFRWFRNTPSLSPEYRSFILPFLMAVAVPLLWIVMEMILMLRSIPNAPFIKRNVHALNRIGIIFFVIAATFLGKLLVFLNFLSLVFAVFLIGSGFFAFTLAALIRQSIVLREENDLTI